MEEIKVTLVDAEVSSLKLKKDDVVVVHMPNNAFRSIARSKLGFKPLTDNLRTAFPNVKVLILPKDFEISVIEKSKALKLKKKLDNIN